MNNSGEAAEQVMRMSLEGVELAVKATGTMAKETIVMIMAVLKSKDSKLKTKGKARLNAMLKSGQPLEIFSVRESDLKQFVQGAKQYGIVYCALKNTKDCPDGMVDIMVKAEDAPKINRIVERFHLATVEKAHTEIKPIAEQEKSKPPAPESETPRPEKSREKTQTPPQQRPLSQAPEVPPSGNTSNTQKKSEKPISSKPSVKKELGEIKAVQNGKTKETSRATPEASQKTAKQGQSTTTHTQPKKGGKVPKKSRGSR